MVGVLRLRLAGPLVAAALAFGVAGCGGDDEPASASAASAEGGAIAGETGANATEIRRLYQAAQDAGESEVNVYPVYSSLQPIADVFNAKFPKVRVRLTPLFGATLFNKLSAEAKSGKVQGDVLIQDTSSAGAVSEQGRVEPYAPKTAETLDAEQKSKDGAWHRVFDTYNGVSYNPNLVKADEVPDTLDGFFTPEWKGKFAYVQPVGYQLTDIVFTTLAKNDRITEEQLKKLKEYGVAVESGSDALPRIAQEQGDVKALLWAPTQGVEVQRRSGAPLESKPIGQQTFYQAGAAALVKGAPHATGAKLFITWLFSKEGQQTLAEQHASYGTVPGSPRPPGYPDLAPYKLTPLSFEEATKAQGDYYTSTLKPIFGGPLG